MLLYLFTRFSEHHHSLRIEERWISPQAFSDTSPGLNLKSDARKICKT